MPRYVRHVSPSTHVHVDPMMSPPINDPGQLYRGAVYADPNVLRIADLERRIADLQNQITRLEAEGNARQTQLAKIVEETAPRIMVTGLMARLDGLEEQLACLQDRMDAKERVPLDEHYDAEVFYTTRNGTRIKIVLQDA